MNEHNGRAMALGFFDGVHLGHAALINRTVEAARENSLSPAVLTFDRHPDTLVNGRSVPLISSGGDREEIIKRFFPVDEVLYFHFDDKMMHLRWDEFAERLVNNMGARYLVAGHDFHFGYMGEGDPEKLREVCAKLGVGCDIIPKVEIDGETVSSTRIRGLLAKGDIEGANRLLGHPYTLSDTVRYGYHLGNTIGFPTINMRFEENVLVPPHGVYATKVHFMGRDEGNTQYPAITNVGIRPTVADGTELTVETFLFDFNGDLYGRHAVLDFYRFLRPEIKFSGLDELKAQITRDCAAARSFFEG